MSGAEPAERPGRVARLLRVGLVRAGLTTYAFTGLILAANVLTGVIVARALGPDGRGIAVAAAMVTQVTANFASMGVRNSLSYFVARDPLTGPRLFSSWLIILVPLTAVAIVVGELVLPYLFAAQDAHTLFLGRLNLLTVAIATGNALVQGLLLGDHDFLFFNGTRLGQPALTALAYAVLWQVGLLTVAATLLVAAISSFAVLALAARRALQRVGIARPDRALGRESLVYGLRAHGDAVAGSLNARLDLVVLPAFVVAASVGLYSVAANVSLIIFELANALAAVLLPLAARDRPRGTRSVVLSLQATLAVSGVLAAVLFVLAGPALRTVYGAEFGAAAGVLRILLPGVVLYGCAAVLGAGLYAAGRPLTATLNQVLGAALTLAGLLVFLPDHGIEAAAIVSTVAYSVVFASSLISYKLAAGIRWREFSVPPNVPR